MERSEGDDGRGFRPAALACVAILAGTISCGGRASPVRSPHVVLVTFDTTRYAQASHAPERALVLDPGRDLDRLRLALVLQRQGERERARELLRTALVRWPSARWADKARQTLRELERAPAAGSP